MQMVPSTGRRLARSLGIRGFTTAIADQSRDQHPARHAVFLAAGRSSSAAPTTRWPATTPARAASSRWKAERPGLDEDEFIDDIPFPETQNYVKRILGTAEDYRRLYGDAGGSAAPVVALSTTKAAAKAQPRRRAPSRSRRRRRRLRRRRRRPRKKPTPAKQPADRARRERRRGSRTALRETTRSRTASSFAIARRAAAGSGVNGSSRVRISSARGPYMSQ